MKLPSARWRYCFIAGVLAIAGLLAWRWSRSLQPSILLITLDTTRADRLGCYGYSKATTPTLDQLATEGVLFEHAITSVPLTLPSHATMLTGRLPPEHGLRVNGMGRLPQHIATLPELFRNRGYRTGAFVGGFVLDHRFGLARGFDHYDDEMNESSDGAEDELGRRRPANVVVDRVLNWLSPKSWNPFFCWMHFYDPHHPCQEHRAEFGNRFAGRAYDAELAFVDQQINRVISELRKTGRLHNTLIVVVGDHGEALGEHSEPSHGHQLYDSTLQVPFLVHWPARISKPSRVSETVGLIDHFPTVVDCLDVAGVPKVSGRSLKPALFAKPLAPILYYAETYEPYFAFHYAWQNAVLFQKWKFIESPVPELYDLNSDPRELKNLIADQPGQRRSLQSLLQEIKTKLRPIAPEDAELDEKSQRALASLGYARKSSRSLPPDKSFGDLPDVKLAMKPYSKTEEALHLRGQGREEQVDVLLRQIVKDYPRFRYTKILYAETLAHRALEMPQTDPKRGDLLQQAESLSREIIAEEFETRDLQKSAAPHMVLAEILSETGRYAEANKAFDQAARVEPQWAQLYFGWGLSLEREGKLDDALQKLDLATSLDPGLAAAHVRYGDILLRQAQFLAGQAKDEDRKRSHELRQTAISRYRLALKSRPQFVLAAIRAYAILEDDQQWSTAATLMEEALKSSPQSVEVRYLWAQALARQNNFRAAAEQFRLVLKQVPGHEGAKAFLSVCEQQSGS